ncbi:L-fucose:H+ symporter permease [Thalassotalea sp. HSM 43]|uniref:L-fucose:H+ symporter permease n=1 Tax=Thalassotalea sp. HSM 43 TaxID=2552945 RepID=UPI001081AF72|nr:L-fucose:H+ symporter permease [Thalassotalea sp. HSM 43]QBY03563.1 L-fucose:H+ symporter permease [Thalassotalea sp. HSM 43]
MTTQIEQAVVDTPQTSTTKEVVPKAFLASFILVTLCFPLWGFANDITNPLVKAFSKILQMTAAEGTLVQVAFYGGYGVMAIPAAIFIKKFSYKAGLMLGLAFYALGAFLFLPAASAQAFAPFLLAFFVMTCGLSFLETSANPYILSMGPAETATRRLNLAQAFNPVGSLLGMFIATQFIIQKLDPATDAERRALAADGSQSAIDQLSAITANDLAVIRDPYIGIALVVFVVLLIIAFKKMPRTEEKSTDLDLSGTFKRLFANQNYREGVIAQMFYVGAQIMCWTFIIHYGTEVFVSLGMTEQDAEAKSQMLNIYAMVIFCLSRFICTFLLKYVNPGKLLMLLAAGGIVFTTATIFLTGVAGVYALVGISACMSLMFPTIYGIALTGTGDDAKLGAAGLIMAIVGGTFLPMAQASIIDMKIVFDGFSATKASFILPLICFVVIAIYGKRSQQHLPE